MICCVGNPKKSGRDETVILRRRIQELTKVVEEKSKGENNHGDCQMDLYGGKKTSNPDSEDPNNPNAGYKNPALAASGKR